MQVVQILELTYASPLVVQSSVARLSFWNKTGFIGSVASLIALALWFWPSPTTSDSKTVEKLASDVVAMTRSVDHELKQLRLSLDSRSETDIVRPGMPTATDDRDGNHARLAELQEMKSRLEQAKLQTQVLANQVNRLNAALGSGKTCRVITDMLAGPTEDAMAIFCRDTNDRAWTIVGSGK